MNRLHPTYRHVLACTATYAAGGLGQHFAQLVEEARAAGTLARYYTPGIREGDAQLGVCVTSPRLRWAMQWTPLRFLPGWRNYAVGDAFDRRVAAQLPAPEAGTAYVGFGGQALHAFRTARRLGYARLLLVAANSHVDHVAAQHRKATRAYPLERSWLNTAQRRKTLREYETADEILVHSEYTRRSFLARGIPAQRLRRMVLQVDARFRPAPPPDDDTFRIVYVGSLTVMKGVPLLLDAFARLPVRQAELTLVGGWTSPGMRRFIQERMRRDPRIRVQPGDPRPHLQRASVCVHPSFEDGFAYAPMEALACGVPVIVSEDTGMKEYVRPGDNGFIVPTGDMDSLVEQLRTLSRRHPERAC